MNIFSVIKVETSEHRGKTALIDGERQLTYADLLDSASEVAESLRQEGVGEYHRVGLLCEDSLEYVVVSLAILSLPAVVVPISPELAAEEIDEVIKRIDLHFLLAEKRLRPDGQSAPFCSTALKGREFTLLPRVASGPPDEGYFRLNPAFIRFSSGTTGASKGVVLSHEAIIERTDAADKGLQMTSSDTVLWVLSMSYHFVVTILLFLRRGATIVLCGRNLPYALLDGVIKHNGTFIYASPFHYSLLSRSADISGDALANVRMVVSTAMKLPQQTADEFAEKFGMELTEAYGIIEVGLPFVRLGREKEKRGSVGRALPDFRIRLLNIDDTGTGEIQIAGKGLLDAYYSPWQERSHILVDGWFPTGDLGQIDADGFLFIVGRKKDVINFVGMKIFANEVEAVINRYPGVTESLVVGIPHESYGELPVARIVLGEGVVEDGFVEGLRRFCYQHLTSYKVPKEFEFVPQLPKTASGKLKR